MHDVFLSPAKANTFWYLKGEITDQISPKTWKYLECMGNPVKAWEIPGRLGISWESIGNPGIAWKILGKHGKSRENTGDTRNSGKAREIPAREVLLKPGKSQAFFLDETCSGLTSPKASKITRNHGKSRESMVNTEKTLNCPGNPGQELLVMLYFVRWWFNKTSRRKFVT